MGTIYLCNCCGVVRLPADTHPCEICGFDGSWPRQRRRFHIRAWRRKIQRGR